MSFDELNKLYLDCYAAASNLVDRPGTFDRALDDLRFALKEIRETPLECDPRVFPILEWYQKTHEAYRQRNQRRDAEIRQNERKRKERNYKATGGIRIWEGGSCSGR